MQNWSHKKQHIKSNYDYFHSEISYTEYLMTNISIIKLKIVTLLILYLKISVALWFSWNLLFFWMITYIKKQLQNFINKHTFHFKSSYWAVLHVLVLCIRSVLRLCWVRNKLQYSRPTKTGLFWHFTLNQYRFWNTCI